MCKMHQNKLKCMQYCHSVDLNTCNYTLTTNWETLHCCDELSRLDFIVSCIQSWESLQLSQRFQLPFGEMRKREATGRVLVQVGTVAGQEKTSERRRMARMMKYNLQTSSEDPQGHLAADGVTVRGSAVRGSNEEEATNRAARGIEETIWTSQLHFGMRCCGMVKQRLSYLVITMGINHGSWRCLWGWCCKIPFSRIQALIRGWRKKVVFAQTKTKALLNT